MRSRALPVVALALLAMFFQCSAKADSLTGLTVTGSLVAPDFLVTPFPPSAVIGDGVEFQGVIDEGEIFPGIFSPFDISANFTDSSLIISVTSPWYFANVFGTEPYIMALSFSGLPTDLTGFALTNYTCVSTVCSALDFENNPDFSGGLFLNTYSGSTLTLVFDQAVNGETYSLSEMPPPSEVPEPSTLLLLSTGLTGAVGALVRRRHGVVATH
jgi:hypothetical protein